MKCPRCQHDNPAGQKFCGECGTQLTSVCPTCRAANPPGQKFCGGCGASLTQAVTAAKFLSPDSYTPKHLAEKILTSKAALEGERKQVTVLFADMKGSMELLADRDPEEARKFLDPVLEHMMEAVHRYEGTVNQVMGDGIMALFGAPLAHEDHAVRACYAALRMQESVKRYAEGVRRVEGIPIHIRVGLNSGEVVVRSIGSDLKLDYTAVGQTTHLAARMEQMAMPGSIMMTADTLRLAEGYVQVKPLGPIPVKGLTAPVEVYDVTGAGPVRSRLGAAASRGLTRFVGRDAEVEQLRKAIERAQKGQGQVVGVVGEPGVGKSRLFYEFIRSHRTHGWLIVESGSVSYGKATPYLPLIDLLKVYFKIHDRDDQRQIREKVTGKILTLDRALEPVLPPVLALLDALLEDQQWRLLDPSQRRQQILEAVKRLFLRETQAQPLLLVFEDLHWVDSETQAVLDSLIESVPTTHILLLVNYRPEYQHGWGSKTYYSQLRLDPLPPESAEVLLEGLLGSDGALQRLKKLLIVRTEGNPFFLEESVRELVETQILIGERGDYRLAKPIDNTQVPATVQAVLAARIDRLPLEEKRLLQSAAVIGKDVPFVLLQAVAGLPEDELRRGLTRLQAAEFVYETSLFPDLEYTFKHALTHEVAYGSLLQERRKESHARIAEVIEQLYFDRLEEHVEGLAHHAFRGELREKTVTYCHQAGRKAAARSAYREAISYFEQALEALKHLPDNRRTLEQAIDIRVDLGPALANTMGWTTAQVEQTYTQARELCQRLGETPQLFPVLWGLARAYEFRGELQVALQLGEQLLTVAERLRDSDLLLEAHHTLWATLYLLGELASAQAHSEWGIKLYDPQQHRHHASLYGGHDPGVCALGIEARILWLHGFPDQALEKAYEGLSLAKELSNPFTLAFAIYRLIWSHRHRGDVRSTRELVDSLVALADEHAFPIWKANACLTRGWLLVSEGLSEEGLAQLRQAHQAVGMVRDRSDYLALLADGYGNAAKVVEGLNTIAEGLNHAAQSGERYFASELYRINGELLLKQAIPAEQEADDCFQRAIEIARRQQAKSLELRAVMSQSRSWHRKGRKEEARALLAEVYDWFTEGFDTADLRQARTLLEKLS